MPYPRFIEETIAKLPEAERECAAEFMLWFDATIASQEMIRRDELNWRKTELSMWQGWRAAWKHNERPEPKKESPKVRKTTYK